MLVFVPPVSSNYQTNFFDATFCLGLRFVGENEQHHQSSVVAFPITCSILYSIISLLLVSIQVHAIIFSISLPLHDFVFINFSMITSECGKSITSVGYLLSAELFLNFQFDFSKL